MIFDEKGQFMSGQKNRTCFSKNWLKSNCVYWIIHPDNRLLDNSNIIIYIQQVANPILIRKSNARALPLSLHGEDSEPSA